MLYTQIATTDHKLNNNQQCLNQNTPLNSVQPESKEYLITERRPNEC